MRVMGLDPGAERMGWACVSQDEKNKGLQEEGCGVFGLKRERNNGKAEPYQQYRLKLIDFWIRKTPELLERYRPDLVVGEIVPPTGTGHTGGALQRTLAGTASTVFFVVARQGMVDVEQVGASSVKARIGGSKKATKVAVRNGVYKILPSTERFRKEWVSMHDTSDAFAVVLCKMGYRV